MIYFIAVAIGWHHFVAIMRACFSLFFFFCAPASDRHGRCAAVQRLYLPLLAFWRLAGQGTVAAARLLLYSLSVRTKVQPKQELVIELAEVFPSRIKTFFAGHSLRSLLKVTQVAATTRLPWSALITFPVILCIWYWIYSCAHNNFEYSAILVQCWHLQCNGACKIVGAAVKADVLKPTKAVSKIANMNCTACTYRKWECRTKIAPRSFQLHEITQ